MSKIKGNKGLMTLINTESNSRKHRKNVLTNLLIFKRKVLSKGALNLNVYKTASCAETCIIRLMTCDKVAINGPNSKKLAQKNQIGESGGERKKKILAQTLMESSYFYAFACPRAIKKERY